MAQGDGSLATAAAAVDASLPKAAPDGEQDQKSVNKKAVADKEAKFLAALRRIAGLDAHAELSEDRVREIVGGLNEEQRQQLMSEGQELKTELFSNPTEHQEELQLFRKELNDRADKADLPVEKDGEHLSKKVLAFMQNSSDAIPISYILEAVVSAPYLVKLALAEAREATPKATPADLAAIEAECMRLRLPEWREADASRPPFVRRNLLLVTYAMNQPRMSAVLQPSTSAAVAELTCKVRRLLDMLFKFCLQNRWVKAALAVTECQSLVLNGLWDGREDECRELMRSRMLAQGLKFPKLSISCLANDCRPGQKVVIKVEVQRAHCYTEEEMKAYHAGLAEGDDAREGWWIVCESIRAKVSSKLPPRAEVEHNTLVGRQAMGCALDAPTMACELEFEAPGSPGEYKVMVHVRSCGCVGVDVRRKVSFQVLKPLDRNTTSSSSGASSGDPVETGADSASADKMSALREFDDLPPPLEGEEPPPLSNS